jgi:dihydropteroate synthase
MSVSFFNEDLLALVLIVLIIKVITNIIIDMEKLKFDHKNIKKIVQLDTGILCVHYKGDYEVHTFRSWREFLQAHPNTLYHYNVSWSRVKAFLSSINIFSRNG